MDKRNRPALAYLLVGVASAGRAMLAMPDAVALQEVSLTVLALGGYLLLASKSRLPVLFGAAGLVLELILSGAPMDVKTHGEIGKRLHGMRQMKRDYIDHLISSIDCDLSGLRVLVDCANGAASATAPDLFRALPLQADFIHSEPDGVNINNGCGSTHLESLARGVVSGGYDLGIAFDGDADRCLLVDETGHTIDGDKVMAVCGADLRRHGKLSGNAIVATVMSNLGLHEYCRKEGIELVCTAVGDRIVLERMLAKDGLSDQEGLTLGL